MPGMSIYAARRKALMAQIGSKSMVILPAAPEVIRTGDAHYPYRQNSDFYYLSGFEEPEAVLILAPNRIEGEFILFNRIRDRDREIWDGPRAGQEGAVDVYKADQSFPIDELKDRLPDLMVGREQIHYTLGNRAEFDDLVLASLKKIRLKIRSGLKTPLSFVDVSPTLHEMRLFKDEAEIALMQKAIDATVKAHSRAMQYCQPHQYEYQLEAELMYIFQSHGARSAAYGSIVASGRNSCILHYVQNDRKISDGDLVLIDAGAEYQNYAADITRTFPANGRFSPEQKAVYDIVLASQLAAIDCVTPNTSWGAMQEVVVRVLTQGLVDLGILKGNVASLIEQQAYLPYYMHRSGHWLGLDVHDVGRYMVNSTWRDLQPGMVLTVEPGLYLSAEIPGLDKKWHNIGVRIEDDVLVTPEGHRVLSHDLPKTIESIETLMAR